MTKKKDKEVNAIDVLDAMSIIEPETKHRDDAIKIIKNKELKIQEKEKKQLVKEVNNYILRWEMTLDTITSYSRFMLWVATRHPEIPKEYQMFLEKYDKEKRKSLGV